MIQSLTKIITILHQKKNKEKPFLKKLGKLYLLISLLKRKEIKIMKRYNFLLKNRRKQRI
jgi:hypothetical protein